MNSKFQFPKKGKHDDKAHPPIYPVKFLEKGIEGLTSDDYRVYEFIARHFLACCSKDALCDESEIEI